MIKLPNCKPQQRNFSNNSGGGVTMKFSLLGVGSPLVDLSVQVSDGFLAGHVPGKKGGTLNITDAERADLLSLLGNQYLTVAGGAAANTIMAAAELGLNTTLLGKVGNDREAEIFRQALLDSGASTSGLLTDSTAATGYCLALVTPDAERTMRSNLGASLHVTPADAEKFDFSAFDWVLLEGYFIGTEFFDAVLDQAIGAGCKIALDLCSFELAEKFRDKFLRVIKKIDLLFANFEEASALTGVAELESLTAALGNFPGMTALKLGAAGSMVITNNALIKVPAAKTDRVVDTTAAGDYYAAGFFYGLAHDFTPEKCAVAAALTSAEIVRHHGTKLTENIWHNLITAMEKI